jgi:hypothetical protein
MFVPAIDSAPYLLCVVRGCAPLRCSRSNATTLLRADTGARIVFGRTTFWSPQRQRCGADAR